jgi:uncharacterized protein YjcR
MASESNKKKSSSATKHKQELLRSKAKKLFIEQQLSFKKIAKEVGVTDRTIANWCRQDLWERQDELLKGRLKYSTEGTLLLLNKEAQRVLEKGIENLDPEIFKRAVECAKRAGEIEKAFVAKTKSRDSTGKLIRDVAKIDWSNINEPDFYEYQNQLLNDKSKTRMVLKCRSIGVSYVFSYEALQDAIENQRDQIFLSASQKQAFECRKYILEFARSVYGLELNTGETTTIRNSEKGDCHIYYLGNSAQGVHGYHGNLYIDEFLKNSKFKEIQEQAMPMAMADRFRITYFSAPSHDRHPGWKMWTSEKDSISRHRITLKDALDQGFDQTTFEDCERLEPDKKKFNNAFMCEPYNDEDSVFKFDLLLECYEDETHWGQISEDSQILIGYDPGKLIDSGVIAVVEYIGGIFRVHETIVMRESSYQDQVNEIEKLFIQYDVDHIGMDINGVGEAVAEGIEDFFPSLTAIHTSRSSVRSRLIIKADQLMRERRLKFKDDKEHKYLDNFLMIKRSLNSDNSFNFKIPRGRKSADEDNDKDHADIACAIMNALIFEGLEGEEEDFA